MSDDFVTLGFTKPPPAFLLLGQDMVRRQGEEEDENLEDLGPGGSQLGYDRDGVSFTVLVNGGGGGGMSLPPKPHTSDSEIYELEDARVLSSCYIEGCRKMNEVPECRNFHEVNPIKGLRSHEMIALGEDDPGGKGFPGTLWHGESRDAWSSAPNIWCGLLRLV